MTEDLAGSGRHHVGSGPVQFHQRSSAASSTIPFQVTKCWASRNVESTQRTVGPSMDCGRSQRSSGRWSRSCAVRVSRYAGDPRRWTTDARKRLEPVQATCSLTAPDPHWTSVTSTLRRSCRLATNPQCSGLSRSDSVSLGQVWRLLDTSAMPLAQVSIDDCGRYDVPSARCSTVGIAT